MDRLWKLKQAARMKAKANRRDEELQQAFRDASHEVKKAKREFQDQYWQEVTQGLTEAYDRGNIGKFYDEVKKACGPRKKAVSGAVGGEGGVLRAKTAP
jgi:predicted metalloprotease